MKRNKVVKQGEASRLFFLGHGGAPYLSHLGIVQGSQSLRHTFGFGPLFHSSLSLTSRKLSLTSRNFAVLNDKRVKAAPWEERLVRKRVAAPLP